MNEPLASPWICHVCDAKFTTGESQACSVCFKTTCPAHLKTVSIRNADSGLYELHPVCLLCLAGKNG